MNKNIIKLLAVLVMCFMIGAVLVACGAQGEQGEKGEQGAPGATGEQGPQGPAGLTPYIGENGNWWIGDEDTGVCPKGETLVDCENHDYWNEEVEQWNMVVWSVHTQDSLGLNIWNCVDCGDTYFEWVDHEYVKGETVDPTCQAEGYTVYSCSCGLEEHRDVTEKIDHILGEKEYVKNEAGICDCEWTNPYVQHCTMCDVIIVTNEDGAEGHEWGEYHPIKPEGDYNPCTWVGGTVANCVKCDCHMSPVIPNEAAKGHKEEEYTNVVVNGDKVVLSYVCDDCGDTITKTVSLADDCTKTTTDPDCENDGKEVYTYSYNVNGEAASKVVETVVLPALGHTVDETCTAVVEVLPTATTEGKISTACATCGEALEMVLPEISEAYILRGVYTVMYGECDDNFDYYGIALSDKNGEINGSIGVDFKIPANYGHNNNLYGEGAEWVVIDINGTLYDAYWCTTCDHWIAVREHVA